MPSKTLVQTIKEARGKLSQGEAAARVGTTQSNWSKWESGRQTPDVDNIAGLARLSGLTEAHWLQLISAERSRRSPSARKAWAVQLLEEAKRLLEGG